MREAAKFLLGVWSVLGVLVVAFLFLRLFGFSNEGDFVGGLQALVAVFVFWLTVELSLWATISVSRAGD